MNCGAKSYRWLLEQEGIALTLESARAACRTTTMGTREPDLRAALQSHAFEIELRQNLSWDELKTLCSTHYVVVIYQCHYSVAVAADDHSLDLYDPDYDAVVHRPRAEFEPVWDDYEVDMDWSRRDYHRAAILVRRSSTQPKSATAPVFGGSAAQAASPAAAQ